MANTAWLRPGNGATLIGPALPPIQLSITVVAIISKSDDYAFDRQSLATLVVEIYALRHRDATFRRLHVLASTSASA
jgi:hypothetical protein